MPHTKSAWKRLRQNEKRRRQNRAVAKKIKMARRAVQEELNRALHSENKRLDVTKVEESYKITQEVLDRAATKGYIHPNKAARLKARLVKRIRATEAALASTDKKN